ncbi:MAG: DUF3089 domain-containing protein [Saprospiraceae bacterium]|nr:DUF3089 domain-containing protein [Saprospiraceae bacterium]
MKSYLSVLCISYFCVLGCSPTKPKSDFESYQRPQTPDYSLEKYWAALPQKLDSADRAPAGLKDQQKLSQADVFFLYPTSFLTKKGHNQWNADVNDTEINQKTDASAILYQASLFNEVGKIYAPRYRQAHIFAFFSEDTVSAAKALDLAYLDIKNAFEYYLNNYNQGRPIILAGHSQGAAHLIRLMKEYFDNNELRKKLVVSYAVGYPIPLEAYKILKPCKNEFETGCICSWRSFKKGYKAEFQDAEKPVVITNPLIWTTEENVYADKSKNIGSVLDNFSKAPVPNISGAQIYKHILWVDKPKFKGSFLYPFSNFHRGDFNIFYMNVRQNAMQRLNAFWKQ